ncbi:UNVERIFIED_CONTAM: amidohydrolase family protein [Microbacterium sp. SLM126]
MIAAPSRIIDAHAHVWDARALTYPWLDAVPALPQTADSARLVDETAASGYIFVEAGAAPGAGAAEAAWVAEREWPSLRGVVAAVDLRAPDLDANLAAIRTCPLVVGVRHNLQGEAEGALSDPLWRRGLEAVATHGLTFDACVRHQQLGELAELIESVPALDVVLDHLGKPFVIDGVDSARGRTWTGRIRRLAQSRNTRVKISGLSGEATDSATLRTHGPGFVRAALDAFGADRCMIGSDWPVSTTLGAAASFATWTALVRSVLSTEEWSPVASGTAERFYLAARG